MIFEKTLGTILFFAALALGAMIVWYRARAQLVSMRRSTYGLIAVAVIFAVTLGSDLSMQKLISQLVMPVGLMWLVIGALATHFFAKGMRGAGGALLAIFLIHGICGNPLVSATLVKILESDVPEYSLRDGPTFDAVLVLGGGVGYRADGEIQVSQEGDRVIYAARLWYAKKTPILVASGSTIPGFDEVQDLSVAAERLWVELGIPADAIVKSGEPKNTSQELAAFKKLAAERGWQRLGVITSKWHMPRVLRGARKIGLEVTSIPADHRGAKAIWHPMLLVPQAGPWKSTQMVAWELVGMMVGR